MLEYCNYFEYININFMTSYYKFKYHYFYFFHDHFIYCFFHYFLNNSPNGDTEVCDMAKKNLMVMVKYLKYSSADDY